MFSNKEYIYEVYKEKSFSKAADKLYISQPSLSATVKKVENKIGAQIFDRSTNPVQLTDCGQEYIKCIEKMMDIENGFENYLHDLDDLKAGNLVVGATNFNSCYILPPIMTSFMQKYPLVTFKLVEGGTASLEQLLFSGTLDMILGNYTLNPNVFKRHYFYSDHLVLAVPTSMAESPACTAYRLTHEDIVAGKHLHPDTPPVPLRLFAEKPHILLRPGNETRERSEKMFKEAQFTPQVVLELEQLATACRLACHGMGITMISDTLAKRITYDQNITYFRLSTRYAKRNNYFYYKHNKYVTRPMQAFLEIARESRAG